MMPPGCSTIPNLVPASNRHERWPHKLTPIQYGQMIAERTTLDEREALLAQVPESWQYAVVYFAAHALAPRIADLLTRPERAALLRELPEIIRGTTAALAASVYAAKRRLGSVA